MKLLTIAIPTFNHHEYLRNQLNRLIPQLSEQINLVIIDNNSDPNIVEYLDTIKIDIKSLVIIQNERNIGADENIFKCLKYCKTKWLWILSDNDYINDTAVRTILTEIKNNSNSIFINFGNTNNTITKNFSEFLYAADYINSFTISNCIYNVSELQISFPWYEASINTHQAQLIFIIKHLETYEKLCTISSKTIIEIYIPTSWPKYAFIKDSLDVYNYINVGNLSLFRVTFGKQIIRMQLFLLIKAYSIEGLTIKNYLKLLLILFHRTNPSQFVSKGCVKLLLMNIFYFFFPILYSTLFSIQTKSENSNKIENLIWNY